MKQKTPYIISSFAEIISQNLIMRPCVPIKLLNNEKTVKA